MGYDGSDRLTHMDMAGPMGFVWPLNSAYDYGYDPATSWTVAVTSTVYGYAGINALQTVYTDTYLYAGGTAPYELLRQQGGTTSYYW